MADEQNESVVEHTTRAVELVTIFRTLADRANKQLDDGWAQMLGVPKSSFEFYTSIAAVARSLAELSAEIEGSHLRPASKAEYQQAVSRLSAYVQVEKMRNLQIDHLKTENDAFRLLTLLDDVLLPNANREVASSTLDEWNESLDGLIADAKNAFSDQALRKFIVWHLSYMQWAVSNYDFLGIDGVSRAYGSMAAELARSQGMKGAQTQEARKWYKKAKTPLIALGVAIAATSAVVEKADNLLTHGGHLYEVVTGGSSDAGGADDAGDGDKEKA